MKPRALLYLRKSTDEHQADSLDTQRAGATRFVTNVLGGEVIGEIVDEGESRAEFKRRRGWARLLALCTAKTREFDTIVVRDESRLGAGARLTVALDDILAAGVRVFYYASGDEVHLDSAEQKIMTAIKSAMAENERAKTAERTREALERKARGGLNVGGKCYGYDNVRTVDADGKGRTTYQINPTEAAIVVEVCRRYAAGESERVITHDLNARCVPPPRAGRRGTGSWSPSCVREIIRRPRYRGLLEWGWIGATYKGGTRVTFERKGVEIITVERPELRIISPELDDAVQLRIADLKRKTGMANFKGRAPRYLLSGKLTSKCGVCGGPMQTFNGKKGQRIIKVYGCGWRHARGESVCTNKVRRPVDKVDAVLVDWLCETVLTENVVKAVIDEVRRRLDGRSQTSGTEADTIAAEIERLDREIKRLVAVAASLDADDAPEELATQIEGKTRRRRELRARLDAARAAPAAIATELDRVEEEARARIVEMRQTLRRNPDEARRVMESILTGPITFNPAPGDRPRFELTGQIATGAVFNKPSDPDGI